MGRLSEITFRLPATEESRAFLDMLCLLLAGVAYAEPATDCLTLTPPQPAGARPVTAFEIADVTAPEIAFDTGRTIGVPGAGPAGAEVAPVEMAELTKRLAGHVHRVDHTGVNLPAATTSPEQWHELVGALAAASTMYRYPTGEQWPFVLPSTAREAQDDIREFVAGREPRFELVHDEWLTRTEWQFALWTDLTRAGSAELFPEPEGFTFPELAEIFRVVPVRSPWPGLGLRFDLCYRIEDGPSDWETGEWLVTAGGRIRRD